MAQRPVPDRAARRDRRNRALAVAAAVLVFAVGAVVFAMSGRGASHSGAVSTSTPVPTAAVATTGPTARPTAPTTVPPTVAPTATATTTPDPGSLPQTDDKPTASSPRFTSGANALWQAIQTDDPSAAMPFFFPLGAYLQVKAISNPESDWRTRLVAAYQEDIHALHAKLGARASTAQLAGVDVPDGQATWVQPGAEYNKGSYWRVYGAQLRYTVDGQAGSFPIASMISWRGEWYVVHLSSIR